MTTSWIFPLLWGLAGVHVVYTWFAAIRLGRRARSKAKNRQKLNTKDRPPVSILVPAWREVATIGDCIHALQAIDYPVWEALILAGGPDGTFEKAVEIAAGDPHFRVMARGPEPKNVALTQGIRAARHEIIVLLDADGVVSPGWLDALVQPLLQGAAASVGHRFPKKLTWISRAEQMEDIHAFAILDNPPFYGDSSLAIWREWLESIGTLPPQAYAQEDWAVEYLLREKGGSLQFSEGAWLHTNRPATPREAWRNAVRTHQARLGSIQAHLTRFKRDPVWAFGMAYSFILFFGIFGGLVLAGLLGVLAPGAGINPANFSLLVVFWLVLRFSALAAELIAFNGEPIWLARSVYWVGLMLIRNLAAGPAILAGRLRDPFYQGPRQNYNDSKSRD